MPDEQTHPCERCGKDTAESDLEYVTTHSGGDEQEWWLCQECKKKSDASKKVWESRRRNRAIYEANRS